PTPRARAPLLLGCASKRRERARRRSAPPASPPSPHVSPLVSLAQAQLLHLELEALPRDLEQPSGVRDIAPRLIQRADDELAFEAAHRRLHLLFETVRAEPFARFERDARLRRARAVADAIPYF